MRRSRLKQLRVLNGLVRGVFPTFMSSLTIYKSILLCLNFFFLCFSGKSTVFCRHQVSTVRHGEHSFHLRRGLIVEKLAFSK